MEDFWWIALYTYLWFTVCLFLNFFLVTPGGMPDLSFLTGDQTGATCSGVYGLVNFVKIISASGSFRKPFFLLPGVHVSQKLISCHIYFIYFLLYKAIYIQLKIIPNPLSQLPRATSSWKLLYSFYSCFYCLITYVLIS